MNVSKREIDRATQLIESGALSRKPGEDKRAFAGRAISAVRATDVRVRRDRRKARRAARKVNR